MSMFGRVIMVGNLACYNQVQVIIAMKVIVMANILTMMMQMIMMLRASDKKDTVQFLDNFKTTTAFRKQVPHLTCFWKFQEQVGWGP